MSPKGTFMTSNEHSAPIAELITAVSNLETDAFVRVYDGDIAPLNGIFVVERKELIGKTPREIQAHFALAFVPRMICDARIPVGAKFALGKLTNAHGKRVSIYRAVTALELSSQRPLTPENLAPVPVEPTVARPRPVKPARPPLPAAMPLGEGFNISNAEAYLATLHTKDAKTVPIPDDIKSIGPDGFPYVSLRLGSDGNNGNGHGPAENMPLRSSLLQSILDEGFGLVLWQPGTEQPVWVYSYGDLLCFRIFGSLRPHPEYDPRLYPETLDPPAARDVRVNQGTPSDQLLPPYARRVIATRLTLVMGKPLEHEFFVFQYPDIDTLFRFKLVAPDLKGMAEPHRRAIGKAVQWCLPYVLYTAATPSM
jgi:hypothetical protein